MIWFLLLIFTGSCVLSIVVNWAARELARRIGLVDRPDGHRKLQSQAIPLAGGIAIFSVTVITLAGLMVFDHQSRRIMLAHQSEALGLLLAGTLILILGVLDDSIGLRGRQKL